MWLFLCAALLDNKTSYKFLAPKSESDQRDGQPRQKRRGEGQRRKISLVEGNAKCRDLKQLTCKGTLRQVFICLRPKTPYPPPAPPSIHTVYVYTVCLFKQGRGGELNQREG